VEHQIDIIHEDNHLLGISKPGGLLVQGDRTGDITALDLGRAYLKETYKKPGNVYLGLVHRIDRPASGVVVFARTSKAAARLTKAFQNREMDKSYLAIVEGLVQQSGGELEGYINRDEKRSHLVFKTTPGAKIARLAYNVIERSRGNTLVEVIPSTGRHHQIRLQMASEGHPVLGDIKYGASDPLPDRTIALHAARLSFEHPVSKERVTLTAGPSSANHWHRLRRSVEQWISSSDV
jgi:23S rRNA pseudouridine1911/1915/1917 synthase